MEISEKLISIQTDTVGCGGWGLVNEYLSENVFQWLAHRHTHRLWRESRGERERARRPTQMGKKKAWNSRTQLQKHEDTERKRECARQTDRETRGWQGLKGRAGGRAPITHPQAAVTLTPLCKQIQAVAGCTESLIALLMCVFITFTLPRDVLLYISSVVSLGCVLALISRIQLHKG